MRHLLLLAILLAAPVARAEPERPPELAALVPAETLLLVECNDVDGRGRLGEGTALGKLFAEPEVKRFLDRLREQLKVASTRNAREPLAMVGLTPEDFDGIAIRRAGFALVGLSMETRQADMVLWLETRAGGEKVARILKALRQAAEAFAGATFTETEVRGRKVVSTQVESHEICVAVEGDRFILTTRAGRMEEILQALDEGHRAPLSASPRVARLRERMGAAKSAVFAYADAPALGRFALDALRFRAQGEADQVQHVVHALGLDAVEAIGFADIPEGAGFRTEAAFLLKERRGLFALASTTPPSQRFAAMTPPDALVYACETCDLVTLWDGIVGLAGAVEPSLRAKLEQAARMGGSLLELDLRKDLLGALGTEWAGYIAWPPGGGLLPDIVLFASVRDRAQLEKTLDAVAAKVREFRRRGSTVTSGKTEFRGKEIRFLEITDKRGDPQPFAPAWAFGEDFVVFGICPQTVKHALMEKEHHVGMSGGAPGGAGPSRGLSGRTDFVQLLGAAPKDTVSTTYVDLGRVVTWFYAASVPALQVAQASINRQLQPLGMRINFEDLPPAEVIARHLSGMLCYTAVEDDCIRAGYVSQIGAPLVVAPVAALAALGLMVSGAAQNERARMMAEQAEARAAEMQAATRAAEAEKQRAKAAALEQEVARVRNENAMLRKRLDELEAQVAELLRETEEQK